MYSLLFILLDYDNYIQGIFGVNKLWNRSLGRPFVILGFVFSKHKREPFPEITTRIILANFEIGLFKAEFQVFVVVSIKILLQFKS